MSGLRAFFPPPRRPVTWRSFAPLVAFLAAFGAACAGAEIGGLVLFTRLWPFALLAFAPWIWWLHLAGGRPEHLRMAAQQLCLLVGSHCDHRRSIVGPQRREDAAVDPEVGVSHMRPLLDARQRQRHLSEFITAHGPPRQ